MVLTLFFAECPLLLALLFVLEDPVILLLLLFFLDDDFDRDFLGLGRFTGALGGSKTSSITRTTPSSVSELLFLVGDLLVDEEDSLVVDELLSLVHELLSSLFVVVSLITSCSAIKRRY